MKPGVCHASQSFFSEKNKPCVCFAGPMLGSNPGWVTFPPETLAPSLERRGYRCLLVSTLLNRYLRFADILLTLFFCRFQIDIFCLQVYGRASFISEDISSWLARKLKKPVIMVFHGGTIEHLSSRHPRWFRRVLNRSCLRVAPSAYLGRVIKNSGFTVQIIPNPIDISDYTFLVRRRVRPRILWMRKFEERYNPELAIHVFSRLCRKYPGAFLTMAGQDKPLLDSMKRLVCNLGLSGQISFPGLLSGEAKREVFSSHDIFINTNRVDNMPVTLIEAAASGLPIVSTKVGGVPDMFEHKKTALLVPDNDIEAMLEAVVGLLKDESLSEKLSLNARFLAKQCDLSEVIPLWEKVFAQVIEAG